MSYHEDMCLDCMRYDFNASFSRHGLFDKYEKHIASTLKYDRSSQQNAAKFKEFFHILLDMKKICDRSSSILYELEQEWDTEDSCICCNSTETLFYKDVRRDSMSFQYMKYDEIQDLLALRSEVDFIGLSDEDADFDDIHYGAPHVHGCFLSVTGSPAVRYLPICRNCLILQQMNPWKRDISCDIVQLCNQKNRMAEAVCENIFLSGSLPRNFVSHVEMLYVETNYMTGSGVHMTWHSHQFPENSTYRKSLSLLGTHTYNLNTFIKHFDGLIPSGPIEIIREKLQGMQKCNHAAFERYLGMLKGFYESDKTVIFKLTSENSKKSCVCCDKMRSYMDDFQIISFQFDCGGGGAWCPFENRPAQATLDTIYNWPFKGCFVELNCMDSSSFICKVCLTEYVKDGDLIHVNDSTIVSRNTGMTNRILRKFWLCNNFPSKVMIF